MTRNRFGLLVACIIFFLGLLCNYTNSSGRVVSLAEKRSVLLRQAALRRLLRQQYQFLPITNDIPSSISEWEPSSDGARRVVGLSSALTQFLIQNSTSLWLDFNTISHGETDQKSTCHPEQNSTVTIPMEKERLTTPLLVSIGNSTQLFQKVGSEMLLVSRSLRADTVYNITIALLETGWVPDHALTLNGVWLSKGGLIKSDCTSQDRTWPLLNSGSSQYRSDLNGCLIRRDVADVIEIIAPSKTLSLNVSAFSPQSSVRGMTYSVHLEQSKLFKVTTSIWALDGCLTPRCQIEKHQQKSTTMPFIYFSSNHPTTTRKKPKAYVFSLGLADFHHLFTTTQPLTRPSLGHYSDAFTTSYANFILTLRRTRWHTTTPNQDKTHAYNSAPSTTPIFILVPPLPNSNMYKLNPLLSTALHNALQNMITHLRKEGDSSTILIDTTGWLDDTDFILTTNHTTTSDTDNSVYSSEVPVPNASGHRKLSHLLELHLCAYLADDQSLCPFERGHDPYVGNLYVPDEVAVGRTIEEDKIQRIKMLLGGLT